MKTKKVTHEYAGYFQTFFLMFDLSTYTVNGNHIDNTKIIDRS